MESADIKATSLIGLYQLRIQGKSVNELSKKKRKDETKIYTIFE